MSVVDGADKQFGITGAELGTYTIDGTNVGGTATKATVPNWGGEGVSADGYFILLHFDNGVKFYSENIPDGKDLDESGNLLFQLGTDGVTAKWLDVEDKDGKKVRYDLSRITAAAAIALRGDFLPRLSFSRSAFICWTV